MMLVKSVLPIKFARRFFVRVAVIAKLAIAELVINDKVAFASDGHSAPSFSDLTFYWVNFILYLGLLVFILRKPIHNGWVARVARIKSTVAQSADAVASAERELNAIEALTRGVAAEQERVRNEIVNQAQLEAQDLARQANERAVRIKAQAQEMLKGEARSAESRFKAELVANALSIAEGRFATGEFASRESAYLDAAVLGAKRLVR